MTKRGRDEVCPAPSTTAPPPSNTDSVETNTSTSSSCSPKLSGIIAKLKALRVQEAPPETKKPVNRALLRDFAPSLVKAPFVYIQFFENHELGFTVEKSLNIW